MNVFQIEIHHQNEIYTMILLSNNEIFGAFKQFFTDISIMAIIYLICIAQLFYFVLFPKKLKNFENRVLLTLLTTKI